jgi:methionyl-tRNA formyltransferase
MRLAFLGTPHAAVPVLEQLVRAGHDVAIVISRPDKRRGRGSAMTASPVKLAAALLGIEVAHSLKALENLDVERGVVVAYGAIIPGAVLERVPMLNVHFSLLPRWRGAAPVERAILAGDDVTGVSIMEIEPTLDTGPVYASASTSVAQKSANELTTELSYLGAKLLVEVLADPRVLASPKVQEGDVTYAEKLDKEEFHLQPSMSIVEVARIVRLGRAFCTVAGRRLRVLEGHVGTGTRPQGSLALDGAHVVLGTGDGAYIIESVQPEGSRIMRASEWWSGARLDSTTTMWS